MEDDTALLDWLETLDRSHESKFPPGHNFLDQIHSCVSFNMVWFALVDSQNLCLLACLTSLIRLGFVLVRGVPVERGPVPKLQVRNCNA